MHGCERDKTNLAILDFPAAINRSEKRRERSSAGRSKKRYREIQITRFVTDPVVSHTLNLSKCRFLMVISL